MSRLSSATLLLTLVCCGLNPLTCPPRKKQLSLLRSQRRNGVKTFGISPEKLPKRHKNLFHSVSREQFERAVAELDTAIPSLQDHQIIVRMMQIAARVGDGHTGVHMPPHFKL
jgi:hypothetical protein